MESKKPFMADERDGLAFILLMQFIKEGFPSFDPNSQIAASFMYADAIIAFKKIETTHKVIPTECPKCGKRLKKVDLSTPDNPNYFNMICADCNYVCKSNEPVSEVENAVPKL